MAFPFPIEIDGRTYTAWLTLPDDETFSATIPELPDYDVDGEIETDLIAEEMGFGTSPLLLLSREWQQGLGYFLSSEDNLNKFLDAIIDAEDAGVDFGWVERADIEVALDEVLESAIDKPSNIRDLIEVDALFGLLEDKLSKILAKGFPDLDRVNWDQNILARGIDEAFNDEEWATLEELEKLFPGEIYSLELQEAECTPVDDTSFECSVRLTLYLLGSEKATWTVSGTIGFRDARLEEWAWEDIDNSDFPYELEGFFEGRYEIYEGEEAIEEHCQYEADEPEVPMPDGDGPYAVFINDDLFGRYYDVNEAREFVQMSQEVIDREGLGESVGVYEVNQDAVEEAEEEGEEFDEDDINFYEEI